MATDIELEQWTKKELGLSCPEVFNFFEKYKQFSNELSMKLRQPSTSVSDFQYYHEWLYDFFDNFPEHFVTKKGIVYFLAIIKLTAFYGQFESATSDKEQEKYKALYAKAFEMLSSKVQETFAANHASVHDAMAFYQYEDTERKMSSPSPMPDPVTGEFS